VTIKGEAGSHTVRVPWTPSRHQRRREIVMPNGSDTGVRPIRAEARATLLHAIGARAIRPVPPRVLLGWRSGEDSPAPSE